MIILEIANKLIKLALLGSWAKADGSLSNVLGVNHPFHVGALALTRTQSFLL